MIEKRRKPAAVSSSGYQEDVEDHHGSGNKRSTYWQRMFTSVPMVLFLLLILIVSIYFLIRSGSSSSNEKSKLTVATHGKQPPQQQLDLNMRGKNGIPHRKEFPAHLKEDLRTASPAVAAADGGTAAAAVARKGSDAAVSADNQVSAGSSAVTERERLLVEKVDKQIAHLRYMKFKEKVVMEKDEEAQKQIAALQELLRELVPLQYGPEPYQVEMKLRFPDSMMQDAELPREEVITFELGPLRLVPYSSYYFLNVMKHWKSGAFHRNAGHVLQAMARTTIRTEGLAFQEYHPQFPHYKYTLGYAGRPGGPEFYISTLNNVGNHGPGSQGSKTEADSCFGKIIDGIDVVRRMQRQPGASKGAGFVTNPANHISILGFHLISQDAKPPKPRPPEAAAVH